MPSFAYPRQGLPAHSHGCSPSVSDRHCRLLCRGTCRRTASWNDCGSDRSCALTCEGDLLFILVFFYQMLHSFDVINPVVSKTCATDANQAARLQNVSIPQDIDLAFC